MPVATPKRETILANVQTTLQYITKAHGYNFDVALVSRNLANWEKENSLPALFIVAGAETASPETNTEYTRSMNVRILAVVDANQDVDGSGLLSKEMEKLLQDIIKVMTADITRANPLFVDYTFYDGCHPLYDWSNPRGFMSIDFTVQFHHQAVNA